MSIPQCQKIVRLKSSLLSAHVLSQDSEDEYIEDTSSDEEQVFLDCDEDMEEEEEGDITFDMY